MVAFYENCTRVILLKMEKTSMDGHVGEDTTFYCVIPFRINGEPQGVSFCAYLGNKSLSSTSRILFYSGGILSAWKSRY